MRLCEMKGWYFIRLDEPNVGARCDVCRRVTDLYAIVSPTNDWAKPPSSARCVCERCFEDWVRRNYEHAIAQELMG